MTNIKTAVSLQNHLFDQADEIAKEMKVSRSKLFALALEDYIQRYRNRQLLEQINRAYTDSPDLEEVERLVRMQRKQRQILQDKS
jgi:metal-responsive CopG/Arc/MetJ family transcriptional regulator